MRIRIVSGGWVILEAFDVLARKKGFKMKYEGV